MKNYNIKVILEEMKSLDDSILTSSDRTPNQGKRSSLSRNELYSKYLKKDFNFSQDEDLQVIYDIIQKQNNMKTTQDLMILRNAFKNIKLFQELSNEIPEKQMFNLFRELLHYQYESRQVVFNQGEIGREFYIILKGSVYIVGNEDKKLQENEQNPQQIDVQTQNCNKEEQNPNNKELVITDSAKLSKKLQKKSTFLIYQQKQEINQQNQNSLQRKSSLFSQGNLQRKGTQNLNQYQINSQQTSLVQILDERTDEEYIKQQYPNYDILAKLEAGTSFGEVALRDQIPRTATAICSGETHFITLKRDAFKRFLEFNMFLYIEQYYSVVQQQNINFVKKIALYKNWTEQMINQMFFYFEKKTFRMNQTIFKEGSSPLGIYLIRQGEIKLYQDVQLSVGQQDKLKGIHAFMRKTDVSKANIFQAPISHIGEGQMFGYEDIVNQTNRKCTAICSSASCTLLFLNKEKFLQFSKRRNTFENAAEESAMKEQWHKEITQKLESFTKNQHEFYKQQELKQKKIQGVLGIISNQRIQSRKSLSQTDLITRGLNRSMPSIHQISLQSQEELSPKYFQKQTMNNIYTTKSQEYISDECMIEKFSIAKVQNHLYKISQITGAQHKTNSNTTQKRRQDSFDICMSPLTAAYTPQQSEKYFKSQQVQSLNTKVTQDSAIPIDLSSYKSKQETETSKKHIKTDHSAESTKLQSRRLSRNGSIYTPSIILSQSQLPLFSTQLPLFSSSKIQQQQYQQIQPSISPFSYADNEQQQFKYHRRFMSQYQDNNLKSVDSEMYTSQQTIRKSSISKDKIKKEIDESLHVPMKLQQSMKYLSDNSMHDIINESQQYKLDLDNQMIPVCPSMLIVKKRIENQYPKLASYNKANTQLKTQLNESQIQQRILISLKLPKLRKSESNLMDIFKQIPIQTAETTVLKKQQQQNQNLRGQSNEQQQIQQEQDQLEQNKQLKSKNVKSSKSIIDTLKQMKFQLMQKQNKLLNSSDQNEKQALSSSSLQENNFSKKNILTPVKSQKSIFDIHKTKFQNYNFLHHLGEIQKITKPTLQTNH